MKKNFVIALGLDCDGFNSGHIYKFKYVNNAISFAKEVNSGSDGIEYKVVNKTQALEYCQDYNIELPTYFAD